MYHFSEQVCQSEGASLEGIRKFFMIEPQLIQDSGLHIETLDFSDDGIVTDFIRFAVTKSFFNAAPRHPYRKGFRVMISSFESILRPVAIFHHRGAPELAAPNH